MFKIIWLEFKKKIVISIAVAHCMKFEFPQNVSHQYVYAQKNLSYIHVVLLYFFRRMSVIQAFYSPLS